MKMSLRFTESSALVLIMGTACFGQHYTQINLVSSTAGVARVTDPQLINPWGMSRIPSSGWWVSDHGTGFSTVYSGAGAKQSLIVAMPQTDPTNKNTPTGTPTGAIFNNSHTTDIHAHISSTPAGADIQVDGAYVGATPADIDLTCCWHDVSIIKPGREPWTRRVRITGGHVTINVQLRK
jgi:PEGA domain